MAKPIRIGIIYHPYNVEHSHAANQFAKLLDVPSRENDFSPGLLPTNFNEDSLRSRAYLEEDGKFAFYISMGTFFTTTLSRIYKGIEPVPMMFIGIDDPVAVGVVQSLEKPGVPVSGIVMEPDSPTVLAALIASCYPQYKKVFLPYTCKSISLRTYERAEAAAAYLRRHNIEVMAVPVKSIEETARATDKYLPIADSILLLEGCLTGQMVPIFARLCFRSEKTLFASVGKAGVFMGAAFSYGPDYTPVIKAGVAMIHRHFDMRKSMESMPVQMVPNNRVLYINEAVLRLLGSSAEFIEKLRKMVDGVTVIMVKYWPTPPPEEEEDRPFK